jgi:uncharacterized protein
MLSFDVRAVAQHAVAVQGALTPSDPVWIDADLPPTAPVLVEGRVSSAGGGRYYWSGTIQGVATQECTRCLVPVSVQVSEQVRALFAEPGVDGEEAGDEEDPDVYTLAPGSGLIDLRDAVREHWLLNVPRFVLCREDCKGLCPRCGENLNHATCACEPARDSRWDALRSARND